MNVEQEWVFLSRGFRPFFFGAGVWAVFAMGLWLSSIGLDFEIPGVLAPNIWHGHEMVFGYTVAVICGFLLTAIPNWTGRLPVKGTALGLLGVLWLAGRLSLLLSGVFGAWSAVIIDISFLWLFLALVLREILHGRNWRNMPIALAIFVLAAANSLFHLESMAIAETEDFGLRLGIAAILCLITLIGGRVVPSFTRNWLVKQGQTTLPTPIGKFDIFTIAVTVLALLLWVGLEDGPLVGALLTLAGCLNLHRLLRWQVTKTGAEALVWVMHLGYGWLAVGLVLLGLAEFWDLLPVSSGLHALTVGAVGTMTLALMTRATLGHAGRQLTADGPTKLIYLCITAAALSRIFLPLIDDLIIIGYFFSGFLWLAAFALFSWHYGLLLLGRR